MPNDARPPSAFSPPPPSATLSPASPASPARPGRGLALFLVVAFVWSWLWALVIWRSGAVQNPPLYASLGFVFMCGPALGALVAARRHDRGRMLDALGLRFGFASVRAWLWLLLAWAIPVLLILVAMFVDWTGPQVAPADPGASIGAIAAAQGQPGGADMRPVPALAGWMVVAFAVLLAPLLNMIATLSEELGWRGWLWDRWRPLGFWRGNLAIGAVWGVWHAPLIALGHNYPGMPVLGPVLMIAFCIMLSPLIGLVRERGGGVWHAGLFHGTINAFAGVGIAVLSQGAAFPWLGVLGIGGLLAGMAGWALVLVYQRHAPAMRRSAAH